MSSTESFEIEHMDPGDADGDRLGPRMVLHIGEHLAQSALGMPGQCVVGLDRDPFYDDIDRQIEPSPPGLGIVGKTTAQIAVRSGPQFVE